MIVGFAICLAVAILYDDAHWSGRGLNASAIVLISMQLLASIGMIRSMAKNLRVFGFFRTRSTRESTNPPPFAMLIGVVAPKACRDELVGDLAERCLQIRASSGRPITRRARIGLSTAILIVAAVRLRTLATVERLSRMVIG